MEDTNAFAVMFIIVCLSGALSSLLFKQVEADHDAGFPIDSRKH